MRWLLLLHCWACHLFQTFPPILLLRDLPVTVLHEPSKEVPAFSRVFYHLSDVNRCNGQTHDRTPKNTTASVHWMNPWYFVAPAMLARTTGDRGATCKIIHHLRFAGATEPTPVADWGQIEGSPRHPSCHDRCDLYSQPDGWQGSDTAVCHC